MSYILREYQKETVDICMSYLNDKKDKNKIVVVLPTGAGKSLCISEVARLNRTPSIVLQPSVELLRQNHEKLINLGGEATIYSASAKIKEFSELTYCTLGSIKKLAKKFKELGVDTVLIDEADSGYSPDPKSMFRKFMKELNPKKVIGFTATPFRLKPYGTMVHSYLQLNLLNYGSPKYFTDIRHIVQIKELVDLNYWAKINYEEYDFNESLLKLNSTGREYTEESISQAVHSQGINNTIYKRVKQLMEQGTTSILIFMDSVENSKKMAEILPDTACVYSGMKDTDRDQIVADFKSGKLKCVTNFGVLSKGFDKPELQVVIMGRPTNSLSVLYQIVGRGVRNPDYPKTKEFLYIDMCNNIKRFGKIEDLTFDTIKGYGLGLFANNYLMTNTPLDEPKKTKEDILQKVAKEKSQEGKFWFGKYKGKAYNEVPINYLEYILNNFEFKTAKLKKLQKELKSILKQ